MLVAEVIQDLCQHQCGSLMESYSERLAPCLKARMVFTWLMLLLLRPLGSRDADTTPCRRPGR